MDLWGAKIAETMMDQVMKGHRENQINELFGGGGSLYDLPKNPTNPTQQKLRKSVDTMSNATLVEGEQAANMGFQQALTASRQNLARQGLTGGSVAAKGFSDNLTQYITAKQRAKDSASSVERSALGSLESLRGQLRQSSAAGIPLPSQNTAINQQLDTINAARANIVPANIGSLFTTAGNYYLQDQVARGQGYQGIPLPGRASPKGTTTGSM
jgi:hypothetical protein